MSQEPAWDAGKCTFRLLFTSVQARLFGSIDIGGFVIILLRGSRRVLSNDRRCRVSIIA